MTGFIMKIKHAFASAFILLLVWQLAAVCIGHEMLLPSPFSVLRELLTLLSTQIFWQTASTTLARVVISFIFGCTVGIAVSVLMYLSRIANVVFSPLISIIRATPVASFIMLTLLWLNHSAAPVFIAVLVVIPVITGNVNQGILHTDNELLEMAKLFKLGKFRTLTLIYVPSVLPYFYSACATSFGMAWKSAVAAEVLCVPKNAIGTQLYYSKIYLETPTLFAWTAVIIVMSYIPELFAAFIAKKFRYGLEGIKK